MGWVVNTKPRSFYFWERPCTHCIGGWVGPRAGLDGCGIPHPTGIRSPGRPARGESLQYNGIEEQLTFCTLDRFSFRTGDKLSVSPSVSPHLRLCCYSTTLLLRHRNTRLRVDLYPQLQRA
jgi:hypothetical protein